MTRWFRTILSVGGVALLAAIAPWPDGYYTFLRFLVAGICGLAAYTLLNDRRDHLALAFGFLTIGVLFNPIVPAHMTRTIWIGVDLVAATFFAANLYLAPRLLASATADNEILPVAQDEILPVVAAAGAPSDGGPTSG